MSAERPLIIIGAGRSGTNALRDALCSLDGFRTWPCDEINYIWRHGNRSHPTDQLTAAHATGRVSSFIRSAFAKQAAKEPRATLVEKTCANSLRVEFVDAVFPDAVYVHLLRDGRDVAASAMNRWTAPLDIPYLAAKARYVPHSDLAYYAFRYLGSRVAKLRSDEDRLSWWGPKFEGMEHLTVDTPLVEVAARQWERCVTIALDQLSVVSSERVITIRYEDLVRDPREALERVAAAAGERMGTQSLDSAAATIKHSSVGRWQSALSSDDLDLLMPIIGPTLERISTER